MVAKSRSAKEKQSPISTTSFSSQIVNARFLQGIGRVRDAEAIYEAILTQDANNAEVLGLLAPAVLQRGDLKLAKKLWRRSLATASPAWIFLRNLHAYLQVLMQECTPDQAVVLASYEIPAWPVVRLPDPMERRLLMSASDMLVALGQGETAIRLLASLLQSQPGDTRLLYALAKSQMAKGAHALAWKALCEVDRIIQPAFDLQLLLDLYSCAESRGDQDGANGLLRRIVAASPVLSASPLETHKANILVLNGRPRISGALSSLDDLHLTGNYPSQLANVFADDFRFSFIFPKEWGGYAGLETLPRPDFILNNNTNGEVVLSMGDLAELERFADSFGVPVVNHPSKVGITARDTLAVLLADVPGVLVPQTARFSLRGKSVEEVASEIEAQYHYPLITRHLSDQQGEGMCKIDTREDLLKVLSSEVEESFFVTQFVDCRGENLFYRKIRAAVIGNEIILIRVDFDTYWLVHARKAEEKVAIILENPELLEAEKKICAHPEVVLGQSVIDALHAIRGRIPLDIFGIDFDVNPEGKLVFFEANATMNLFSTVINKAVDYPREAEGRMSSALQSYFASLLPGKAVSQS